MCYGLTPYEFLLNGYHFCSYETYIIRKTYFTIFEWRVDQKSLTYFKY